MAVNSARRRLLSVIGSGVLALSAGCSTFAGGDRETDQPNERRRVSFVDITQPDPEHEVAIEVRMTEPEVTHDHPAMVEIRITNEGPDRVFSGVPHQGVFQPFHDAASEDPPGLVLRHQRKDRYTPDPDDSDGQWSIPDPGAGGGEIPGGSRFESGTSFTEEYAVYDDAKIEGYYSPGTYGFSSYLNYTNSDAEDESSTRMEWGLELDVSR